VRTRVGYAGGSTPHPTYHDLGDHTESIEIDYDPAVTTYERLLDVFWAAHEPTVRPYSTQYKAVVFAKDAEQKRLAEESRTKVAKRLGTEVVTEILPAGTFTPAEDYHQKHRLRSTPGLMAEFREMFGSDAKAFRESTAAARVNGYLDGFGTLEQLKDELPALGLTEEGAKALKALVVANRGTAPSCGG
jgi:methionine-S-sulfoxide reductase